MENKYNYLLCESYNCPIYITDDYKECVKVGIETFFARDEKRFEVRAFLKGLVHDDPPRYGEDVLTISRDNVRKMLSEYKEVSDPSQDIIETMVEIIAAQEQTKPLIESIVTIDEQIAQLEKEKRKIKDEATKLFDDRMEATIDSLVYERKQIEEKKKKINARKIKEENFNIPDLGAQKEFSYQFNKDVTKDGDYDHVEDICYICKDQNKIALYYTSITVTKGNDYDESYENYNSYLCPECLEGNVTDILKEKIQLGLE